MDGLRPDTECGLHDRLHLQIAVARPRRSDADGSIRLTCGQGVAVGLGDGQRRLDAEPAAGADDAHGDLTTVGDEDAANDHVGVPGEIRSSTCPYSTSAPSCARISATVPRVPARTVFMSFITSMMPMMVSSRTADPSSM